MRSLHVLVTAGVLGCAMLATPARGQAILSNLPGTGSGTGTTLGLGIDALDRAKGVGLTTGGDALEFVSMVALISNTTPASTLSGGIFANAGGNPGALLAAFTPVPVAASIPATEMTLTVPGGFTLNPATSYWFVLDGPSTTNSLLWQSLTPNVAPTAAVGIVFNGYRFSSNGGATWAASTTFNGMTINAVVPEPATLSAALVGGAMLLARRRGR